MALLSSSGLTATPSKSLQTGVGTLGASSAANIISKGNELVNNPTPAYTGQLTAGTSDLQNQAFKGLSNLTLPSALVNAGQGLQDLSAAQAGSTYSGPTSTNQYAGTGNYAASNMQNQFSAPGAYQSANVQNTFTAPGAFQAGNLQNTYGSPNAYQAQNVQNTYGSPNAYQAGSLQNTFRSPNAYQAQDVQNTYTSPNAYQAGNLQNTYSSPNAYQSQNVTGGTFDSSTAQQYMNPYLQQALAPQLEEARRQALITQQGNAAKATSQGAFGGSRAALMEAEGQRNLGTNLANITGQGYNTAFNNAMSQFNADQARNMTAQQANVQQAQFAAQQGMTDADMKAKYGMTAQQANEASRQFAQTQSATDAQMKAQYGQSAQQAKIQQAQFAAQQGMTDAQMMAQFGMTAQQANEASRQFAQTQAATDAQMKAQYGMTAQQANVQQAQFAAQQGMTDADMKAKYGMTAAQANEASRQFAANQAMTGAQNTAQYGLASQAATEASRQFAQNQAMTGAQNAAQFGQAAQQANEASRQFGQGQSLANAQAAAQYGQAAQAANLQNAQFGATYGLQGLQNAATSMQGAANAGAQQAQYGLQNLQALSTAGNTQQAQNQAGLNALYNQYLDQRNQGFANLANQAGLVKGLGGQTQNTFEAEQSALQKAAGATGLAATLVKNLKSSGMDSAAIDKALRSLGLSAPQTNPVTGLPTGTGFGDDFVPYTTDSLGNTYKTLSDGTSELYRSADNLSAEDEDLYSNLFR